MHPLMCQVAELSLVNRKYLVYVLFINYLISDDLDVLKCYTSDSDFSSPDKPKNRAGERTPVVTNSRPDLKSKGYMKQFSTSEVSTQTTQYYENATENLRSKCFLA